MWPMVEKGHSLKTWRWTQFLPLRRLHRSFVSAEKQKVITILPEKGKDIICTGYYGNRSKEGGRVQRKLLGRGHVRIGDLKRGRGKKRVLTENSVGRKHERVWKGYLSVCKRKTSSRSVLLEGKCEGQARHCETEAGGARLVIIVSDARW